MHPTIDDQVHGALRLLDVVVAEDELPDRSRESLENVQRLLRQIGRSWAKLPEFYARDNVELTSLLVRSAPRVSENLAAGIHSALAVPAPPATDVPASGARNAELRALLSAVLPQLPRDGGNGVRAELGDYLHRRVEADPA